MTHHSVIQALASLLGPRGSCWTSPGFSPPVTLLSLALTLALYCAHPGLFLAAGSSQLCAAQGSAFMQQGAAQAWGGGGARGGTVRPLLPTPLLDSTTKKPREENKHRF
jgi:anti-sigma factor RsiW